MTPLRYHSEMRTTKPLPPRAKKILTWLAIVGPVCAAVGTMATTAIDVRARAREAKIRSTVGYNTLAPAVQELQGLSEEAQAWVDSAHRRIVSLEEHNADLEKRLIRLEGYIEALGKRRNLPAPPAMDKAGKPSRPPVANSPRMKSPTRLIPEDIQKAQTFQKQRDRLDCDREDSLCGQQQ